MLMIFANRYQCPLLAGDASEEEIKERQARALEDPEIQAILQDPVMRQVLNDFQTNPKAAQQHEQNPGNTVRLAHSIKFGDLGGY